MPSSRQAQRDLALGQSKRLAVLGIPASQLERAGYSPGHRDMRVIAVEFASQSTDPWVAEVLEQVARRIGTPVQILADHGSDLRKGIGLFQQHAPETVYRYDISHRIATLPSAAAFCQALETGSDLRVENFMP